MKKTIIFLIIIFTSSGISYALEKQSSWEEILSEQLNSLNLYQLEKEFKKINQEFLTDLPWPSLPELIKGVIKGELAFDFRVFMKYFLEVFFQEIRLNLKLLGQLLVLAIIASLLELMAGAFSHEGISHLTRAVVSMVLIFILISSLQSVLGYGQGTIKAVVDIMIALLPLLIALLMSMGAVTSAAVFQPIVLLGITYMSNVISNLVLPLIFFAAILALINGFSKDFNISKLAKLLRDVSVALLGSILIIFSGLMALQGTAVAVGDGLAMRAAKYLTGAVVPVFGSMFADALELVAGCSLLIKNALGLVGLLGLIIVTVFPLVKIFAIIVVYKLVAALIEPLGEVNMAETLSELGNILVFLLLAVAAVAIMAFVCLTMIVGLANVIVMLR